MLWKTVTAVYLIDNPINKINCLESVTTDFKFKTSFLIPSYGLLLLIIAWKKKKIAADMMSQCTVYIDCIISPVLNE